MIISNGIHAPTIKTNAWKAISNSKIELIAYEKLSTLADIQERKENLSWRVEKEMDFLFQNMDATDQQKKQLLIMTIRDIVGAEKRLLTTIEEILENQTVPSQEN